MTPHRRVYFWLPWLLGAIGFLLAFAGCYVRSSSVVALGLVTLGLTQFAMLYHAIKSGQMQTNRGLESREKSPITFWANVTLFGIAALVWTVAFTWCLLMGVDMFRR